MCTLTSVSIFLSQWSFTLQACWDQYVPQKFCARGLLGCILGWTEKKNFRKFITLGCVSLIRHKKTILTKFQLFLPKSWHSTPRLKITKITKNHQNVVPLYIFLDFYESLNKNTNRNHYHKHFWADTKKFYNQCHTACNAVWICVKEV